jgi:hypothetical protein
LFLSKEKLNIDYTSNMNNILFKGNKFILLLEYSGINLSLWITEITIVITLTKLEDKLAYLTRIINFEKALIVLKIQNKITII